MRPGVYPGLTMAEYLKIPAVSQGDLQNLLDRCPQAAWFNSYLNPNRPPDEADEDMDAGAIAHAILLEGSRAKICVIDPQEHPAVKTGNIPTGWQNKSIRAARDEARANGLLPVLAPRMKEIDAMVTAAQIYIELLRTDQPEIHALFQPGGGDSELTMVWEDDGVPCRIRHDRISTNHSLIVDAKFTSTSAHPDAFGASQLVRMGYYIAAAFYRRGVMALYDVLPDYVFLVIETEAPYLCSLVGLDPLAAEMGNEKIARALKEWRKHTHLNRWPGYPARVAYPEIPAWEVARWQEQTGGEPGIPYEVSKLFRKEDFR